MADKDLELEIGAKDNSDVALKGVADNLATLQERAQDLASGIKVLTKGLESAEKTLSGVGTESRDAAEAITASGQAAQQGTSQWEKLNAELELAKRTYAELARAEVVKGGTALDALPKFDKAGNAEMKRIAGGQNPDLFADLKKEERAWDDSVKSMQTNVKTLNGLAQQRAGVEEKSWQDSVAAFKNGVSVSTGLLDQKQEAERADLQTQKTIADAEEKLRLERVAAVKRSESLQAAARAEGRKRKQAEANADAAIERQRNKDAVVGSSTARAGELAAMRAQLIQGTAEGTRFANVTGLIATETKKATSAMGGFDSSLANTRYAMHDVSMTAGMMGTAILGGLTLGAKAVMDYETALANIERTGEMTKSQAAELRDEFVSLAQEIPMSFNDLGRIGELAGQLNVSSDRIADFTESVAMFGATTDVTVDAAATAFGRLDALLPDVQGQYDRLGSSILKVGINSVATESEIIATTSQIAAAGAQAGMTADQVIGLSASFASLGVAPEAARGTVIRVLGLMNAAVAQGGETLEAFATTAGMSADKFAASWGTSSFTDSFVGFLDGIDKQGTRAQLALKDLGIWAARDQNNLLKLSQGAEDVAGFMSEAADGFNNAGFMSEQFGIKADTLAAKVQLLVNNITNLVAQAGELGGGALAVAVDSLNGLLSAATELADNKLVQWLVTSYAAVAALSGVLLLATSGFGRVLASSLALKPVMQQGRATVDALTASYYANLRAVVSNNAGLTAMQTRMAALRGMVTALKGAFLTLSSVTLATSGAALIGMAISSAMEKAKSSVDKAKEAIGGFDGILAATKADGVEALKTFDSLDEATSTTGSGYKMLTLELDETSGTFKKAETAAQLAASAQVGLADSTNLAGDSAERLNVIWGKTAQTALKNAILSADGMKEALLGMAQAGFDLEGFFAHLTSGELENAKTMFAEFRAENDATRDSLMRAKGGFSEQRAEVNALYQATETANGVFELTEGIMAGLGIEAYFAGDGLDEAGNAATGAAGGLNDAEAAATALSEITETLSAELDNLKSSASLGDAMAGMIEAFGGGAMAAELMGGTVIGNVDNIQKSVEHAIKVGANFGFTAVESVSALFAELQKQGVDTANLLSALSGLGVKSLGGVSLGAITQGMQDASTNVGTLSGYFGDLANNARKSGEASKGAGKGIDEAGKAAKKAAEKVRTLVDYANDLTGVWDRAFDIRFGAEAARDTITQTFHDIRNRIDEAKQKVKDFTQQIRELKATGQQLQSDKAITEYFLRIARSYGDTLRAGELSADLAKINADIKKNGDEVKKAEAEKKKAQDEASTSLEGNSEQAIKNRETVRTLVKQYEDQLAALASSGLSTAELAKQTKLLKEDFMKQLTALGLNKAELSKYGKAFDDVALAIQRVPRNVTVKANVNPALQALNEFEAKAKANLASVTTAANNTAGAMRGVTTATNGMIGAVKKPVPAATFTSIQYEAWRTAQRTNALAKSLEYMAKALTAKSSFTKLTNYALASTWATLASKYSSGGFTGRGGKFEEAGIVHKGEYVVPKEGVNQSTGKPKAEWLARNVNNTAPGAGSSARINSMAAARNSSSAMQRVFVINPVELGAQTVHMLSNSGGGDVIISANQIGAAAGQSNKRNTQIGSS